MKYFSQYGQDEFLDKNVFKDQEGGFFVDIGAHDGVSLSNTAFFEKYRHWSGICFEPNPHIFSKLKNNRSCIKIEGCVAEFNGKANFLQVKGGEGEFPEMLSGLSDRYDPKHYKRVEDGLQKYGGEKQEIQVSCYKLNDVLNQYQVEYVDYCSVDVEGGEMQILQSIDFSAITIKAFTVENNFNSSEFRKFMRSKKYKLIKEMKGDEIYLLREKKNFWKFWE